MSHGKIEVSVPKHWTETHLAKENEELKNLLKQVVDVMDSEEYRSQIVLAHVHGFRYNGPRINMKRVREVLKLEPKEGDHDGA